MGTRYCPSCDGLLRAQSRNGELSYFCPKSGRRFPARDQDHEVVVVAIADTTQIDDQYAAQIRDSPWDPVSAREAASCPAGCGADTMTYVRLTADETFRYTCDCGAVFDAKGRAVRLGAAPPPLYPLIAAESRAAPPAE